MTTVVGEMLKQAELLSLDEQLALVAGLIERARGNAVVATPRHKWLDALGAAPYPLTGEDAQTWVSRTRQEGDDERAQQWRS